jgi:hypothetical protein
MKPIKIIVSSFWLVLITNMLIIAQPSALTFSLNGGRFGDHLISYCKAKYLSYKYDVPLIVESFPLSEQLALSKFETGHNLDKTSFNTKITINDDADLMLCVQDSKKKNNHLFESTYGSIVDPYNNFFAGLEMLYLKIVQDKGFGAALRKMLQPISNVEHIDLPNDRVTVAVHVRLGGGFDRNLCRRDYYDASAMPTRYSILNPATITCDNTLDKSPSSLRPGCTAKSWIDCEFEDERYPGKFPPEQFYVEQIQRLSEALGERPLYVYIFTDDAEPQIILERIKTKVNKGNISYATRTTQNSHDINIVSDFWSMAQFDCLIRPISHFSWAVQLAGNHKIIMVPCHSQWLSADTLHIDHVNIFMRKPEANDPRSKLFRYVRWP